MTCYKDQADVSMVITLKAAAGSRAVLLLLREINFTNMSV